MSEFPFSLSCSVFSHVSAKGIQWFEILKCYLFEKGEQILYIQGVLSRPASSLKIFQNSNMNLGTKKPFALPSKSCCCNKPYNACVLYSRRATPSKV